MKKHSVLVVSVVALSVAGAGLAVAGYAQMHSGSGTNGRATGGSMMSSGSYAFARQSCAAPAGMSGSRVDVLEADMGMSRMMGGTAPRGARMMLRGTPATVPAGQVSIVVSNQGWRTHELVVLPLATGQAAGRRLIGGDGKVSEQGSLGEASASCAGDAGTGIASGTVGWTTLRLQPGRYEILCNLENHYAGGMWQELDVA